MRVELIDIYKYFGSVSANEGVSLTIDPGRVYGILGENGAGKSTLMKILAGFHRYTRGTIRIDGREIVFKCPWDASARGIGMLYQEPLDFSAMTVMENFMIGRTSRDKAAINQVRETVSALCRRFGFLLAPNRPVRHLTLGERQQLEIIRLLAKNIRVLILDEPTTGISAEQKALLFKALTSLAEEGRSIILVSHKLEDIETLCDQITVLRRGRVAGTCRRPFERTRLLSMMFGKPPEMPKHAEITPGKPVIEMASVEAAGGRTGLKTCSFSVREGEIVGLAGLEGSGQGVLLRVAAGLKRAENGTIRLYGRPVLKPACHAFRRKGVFFLPAARLEEGLVPGMTLSEHFEILYGRGFLRKRKDAAGTAAERIRSFRIKGNPEMLVEALSGGNQQKFLLSLLPDHATVLLLEHPARGLDVASATWVWRHLQERAMQGTAVVFSSSELDEIFRVAHRIAVFFNGRIVLDELVSEVDPGTVSAAIAGVFTPDTVKI